MDTIITIIETYSKDRGIDAWLARHLEESIGIKRKYNSILGVKIGKKIGR